MISVQSIQAESARRPAAHRADPAHLRILVLSLVNHLAERNGASTVTRGLLKSLESPPLNALVECIPVRKPRDKWHRLAQCGSLLQAAFSNIPSKVAFLRSEEFRARVVSRFRAEHFDLAILNGSDLLWISEFLPASVPRILISHNIEHLLFESQIQDLGRMYRPFRAWLRRDAQRLRRFEVEGMRSTGNVVFLSHDDALFANRICRDLRYTVVPPMFDYAPPADRAPGPDPGPGLRIGYVGNFGWWPNRQGLQWFASRVLPHLSPAIRVNLFGSGSDRVWRGDSRVVGYGVVEEMDRIWAQCDFMICPAFAEGGVCVKFAEAVYNRMPILANRHAARGLPLASDPAIVFAEEPSEWIEFLNSPAAAELAGRRVSVSTASAFAPENYSAALHGLVRESVGLKQSPVEA